MKICGSKKFAPSSFSQKIPNRQALRDFFYNHCKKYCPSYRDLTASFAKEVLAGKKFLLNLDQVKYVDEIPQFKELSTKNVWNSVKNDPILLKYFPDFNGERAPRMFSPDFMIFEEKPYLLNVLNTLRPNSVINAVKKLKDKQVEKEINENPIIVNTEYSNLLENFQTISLN